MRHILITHLVTIRNCRRDRRRPALILGFGPHPSTAVGEGEDVDDDDDNEESDDTSEPAEGQEPQPEEDPEFLRKHAPMLTSIRPQPWAGDLVEGPGHTVEALHTPGHISSHLCFAVAESTPCSLATM